MSANITAKSYRRLATVFTRPILAGMAQSGDASKTTQLLIQHGLDSTRDGNSGTLANLFDQAWDQLAKNYRNEYVYKNELANKLIFQRHSPRTASFHVELNVGRSIIDVAVANGTSTAYEIKTEFDNSRRLQSQTADYLKAFDKVYVVTHPHHVVRYERELDERVGIILLSDKTRLTLYRAPTSNMENLDVRTVFGCLRRNEYLSALKKQFGDMPPLPNGLIANYCEKLFCTLPSKIAHNIFVNALRTRTITKSNVEFMTLLPVSLRALGYATPMSASQQKTLLELLSSPIALKS